MFVNAVKGMIRKFEETGSLDVAPGRGLPATEPAIVEEVTIATAEASTRSLNATVSNRSKNEHCKFRGNRVHDFTQHFEVLPLQDAFRATVETARSLGTS